MNTTFFLDKVAEFHAAFRVYDPGNLLDDRVNALRISLMREECDELAEAKDRVEQLDALCDLQYVLSGSALAWGLREDYDLRRHLISSVNIDRACSSIKGGLDSILGELAVSRLGNIKAWTAAIQFVLIRCVYGLQLEDVFEAAFAEVHRSNMSKLWTALDFEPSGVDGKYIVKREDGKVMKSPSYSPANLAQFVA